MKIKRARKIITLMLVLLLAAQLTSIVSAATVTWTGSDGYTYAATVSKGGSTTGRWIPVTSSKKHHTRGQYTTISAGTYNVTTTGDMSFTSTYSDKLKSAASSEGLTNSYNKNVALSPAQSATPNMASGYYCLRTTVNGNTGSYRVEKIGPSSTTTVKSGSFSFAPYACAGNTLIYCLSVDDSEISR